MEMEAHLVALLELLLATPWELMGLKHFMSCLNAKFKIPNYLVIHA
jgi:hypothetical protein